MPDRPSFAKALVTFRPPLMSWRTTLFLVAPVWFGLIFFTAIGQPIHGLLVALGAYIVLFGGGMPWKPRLRAYVIAAVGLVVSVVVGMMNADSLLHTWEAYLAVALVAVVASLWLDPGPPGPYFFVLMVGGGLLLGPAGVEVSTTAGYLSLGALLAMIMGTLDALIVRPPELPRATQPVAWR